MGSAMDVQGTFSREGILRSGGRDRRERRHERLHRRQEAGRHGGGGRSSAVGPAWWAGAASSSMAPRRGYAAEQGTRSPGDLRRQLPLQQAAPSRGAATVSRATLAQAELLCTDSNPCFKQSGRVVGWPCVVAQCTGGMAPHSLGFSAPARPPRACDHLLRRVCAGRAARRQRQQRQRRGREHCAHALAC